MQPFFVFKLRKNTATPSQTTPLRNALELAIYAQQPGSYYPHARSLAHRNLLKITATIKRTRMVMMAIVITRFVAILQGHR